MSDLIPGNTSSNTTISIGSSVSGRLDFNGDTDWYRVQFYPGFSFQIFLEGSSSGSGTLWDPLVVVRNASGGVLTWADDTSLFNLDAYISYLAPATGTYFISAEESGNNATGSYILSVWQDQLASVSTGATVTANSVTSDRIGWRADQSDWYAITLTAGVNYQFDVTGSALHGASVALADPRLVLRNANGTLLLSDDDGGNGLNSRIFFTPTVSGTYYLDVQESGSDGYGVYSLIVNEAPVSGTLQLNVPWQDAIAFQGDFDLLGITLTRGISYGFSIQGQTLTDPYLELLNSTGVVVATDDDSGPGLNSLLAFTPTTSGTYYLAARAANYASLGSYTAQAWELPSLSIEDAYVLEGNTANNSINFPITLSKASPSDITITIGTRAGTASTASGDYQGIWETTITIPAGQTSAVFSIPVGGDTEFEPNEGFGVVISNADIATIADGEARGWIFDDDAPYPLPDDLLSRFQWHLYPDVGANVFPVWDSWDGSGIRVAVFDQGVDSTHTDLNDNLLSSLGRRASNLTAGGDPVLAADNHGTPVAGVIAAEANGDGVIGVAPKASLVSIYSTLASSPASFSTEISNAFTYAQSFDVLNNSWGFGNYSRAGSEFPWAFLDNFRSPTFAAAGQALKGLAENGRHGLGTVVVQSAGNSYALGDDTNLHNFQNSRYIITVAGTDYQGKVTSYSSPGASVLIAAPGGELNVNNDILSQIFTTDRVGAAGYSPIDVTFIQGTSFSGPVVAGVVALMLDANPTLGYRDVQQIIAYSGRKIAEADNDWKYNGASHWNGGGLHYDSVNHNLGFGLIDALTAVRLAESWSTLAKTSANDVEHAVTRALPQSIPDGNSLLQQTVNVTEAMQVERVEVTVDISHGWIGDLSILLTSPAGTSSWLLWRPGQADTSPYGQSQDNINFTFNTVLSWGEKSVGTWTLSVFDQASLHAGTLNSWTLNLIGQPVSADDVYVYTNEFSDSVADQTARATLTDSGGIDTINASAVSAATSLNLQAGSQSSIDGRSLSISAGSLIEHAVTGDGSDAIAGNQAANSLRGMRGNDSLSGGEGQDSLEGGPGNDALDGGLGTDLAVFNGLFAGYRIERSGTDYRIVDVFLTDGDEGTDLLRDIEEAKFSDMTVQLASLDLTPPTVSTFSPADGAGSVAVGSNISLTFSENIQKGDGHIEIRQGSVTGTLLESFHVATSTRVSVSGSTLTIDPTHNLTESVNYFVVIPAGSIRDLAGNPHAGINTYDFTANASPVANGFLFTTNEDTVGSGTLTGTDAESKPLTFSKVTDPVNGAVTINATTGAYTYTPNTHFNGQDSFRFKVNDGTVDSEIAAVMITVVPVNDRPTGGVTISGSPTLGQLLTASHHLADAEGLGDIRYQWLVNGSAIVNATSHTFQVSAAHLGNTIAVRASYTDLQGTAESVDSAPLKINAPPVARDNSYTIAEDETLTLGNLISDGWAPGTAGQSLFHDTDADGDTLSISAITVNGVLTAWADLSNSTDTADLADAQRGLPWKAIALPNGTAWLQSGGGLRYAGKANNTLGDTLGYTITDGQGGAASAQVQIQVLPTDDPATATWSMSGSAKTGGALSLSVITAADPDGSPRLAYQWQWLNEKNWQNIEGATGDTWAITTGGLWADRAVRAQLSTTDPLGGTSVFHTDVQTIEASSQLVLSATHWKTGQGLPGVGLGLFDGDVELKTGLDGTLSAQGFEDPDGVDDGQTVLNPTLAADPKQANITLTDVLGALKVYLNKPLDAAYDSPYKYIAADFQGDGDVDLSDVLSLLKYYLKKPVDAAPSWVFVDSAQTVTVGVQILPASSSAGQALSKNHAAPADIHAHLDTDIPLQLVGVLRGDLDGSGT